MSYIVLLLWVIKLFVICIFYIILLQNIIFSFNYYYYFQVVGRNNFWTFTCYNFYNIISQILLEWFIVTQTVTGSAYLNQLTLYIKNISSSGRR